VIEAKDKETVSFGKILEECQANIQMLVKSKKELIGNSENLLMDGAGYDASDGGSKNVQNSRSTVQKEMADSTLTPVLLQNRCMLPRVSTKIAQQKMYLHVARTISASGRKRRECHPSFLTVKASE
jgi:hypothetical protein